MTEKKGKRTGGLFSLVEHNPFTEGFGHDRFIFVQMVALILLLALANVAGYAEEIGERRMNQYYALIPIGVLFVVIIQTIYYAFAAQRTTKTTVKGVIKDAFIYTHAFGWIIIGANILLMTTAIMVALFSKEYETYQIIDVFFVAGWEQLIFAVMCMSILVQFFRSGIIAKLFDRKFVTFFCSLVPIDLIFGFAHWWAYGGDVGTILVLTVTGLVFLGIGYRYPSLGISLHFAYNIIVS